MMGRASNGGILNPSSQIGATGKTVLDVLREKYPEPAYASEKAFLQCDELPPITDVDVTGPHVEKVTWKIQGGARPGGTTAHQCQDHLLRHGAHSERLRDTVVELARC